MPKSHFDVMSPLGQIGAKKVGGSGILQMTESGTPNPENGIVIGGPRVGKRRESAVDSNCREGGPHGVENREALTAVKLFDEEEGIENALGNGAVGNSMLNGAQNRGFFKQKGVKAAAVLGEEFVQKG